MHNNVAHVITTITEKQRRNQLFFWDVNGAPSLSVSRNVSRAPVGTNFMKSKDFKRFSRNFRRKIIARKGVLLVQQLDDKQTWF